MALFSGLILLLLGVAMAFGGIWLAWLGGSLYYLVASAALLLSGALLMLRRPGALWIYAALLLGTLAWSIWEVGLDWWALIPRGVLLVAVGLWLLLPWLTRRLNASGEALPWTISAGPLALAVVITAAVAVVSWFDDPYSVEGELPGPVADLRADAEALADGDWHAYGRTGAGQRYSPLEQITPDNVGQLEKAWEYHTGDVRGDGDPVETTYEVTPLKIGDTLYLCTPHHLAIALDADSGEERWTFDPNAGKNISRQHQTCRGLSYFPGAPPQDAERDPGGNDGLLAASGEDAMEAERQQDRAGTERCQQRLFLPTGDARLIALDPEDGEPCERFGDNGTVNLWANMPHQEDGFYYSTSPPVVTEDLVIIGGAVNDNVSTREPSGVIRAYDVDTGELVWNWDPGNPEQTDPIAEGETYSESTPNSWSISSVDEDLGLVYVPMGNQVPDQWGIDRNQQAAPYSSAVVALELDTGQVRWHFQTIRNDLWDMDVPAQPTLVDLDIDGETVPALVQPTKQGDLYVLDRRDGEPVLPVEEQPAPQGSGLQPVADTQPRSQLSLEPDPLEERDMWGATPFDQLACRIQFQKMEYEGRYTPPSEQGSLIYPGNFGVFNWGGIAVDPERQVAFTTPGYLAFVSTLVPREDDTTNYVSEGEPGLGENYGAPYAVTLKPFMSPVQLPCQQPPWGAVAGADLRTGEVVWKHRNGTVRDLAPVPVPLKMGVPDLGGPMITGGGVAFMSGTLDYFVRAYDLTSGEMLWEDRLPAGGQATPMSYEDSDGNQVVVVVAGGHGSLGTKAGDSIIAYKLGDD